MNDEIDRFVNTNWNNLLKTATNIINKNGSNDDPYELLNYSLLQLLESKKSEEIVKSGFAFFWIVRVMTNSIYSQTSDYHRNIRPYNFDIIEDKYEYEVGLHNERESVLQAIETIMDDIEKQDITGWYIVNVFKIWLQKRSITKVSIETDIPRGSIHKAIKRCKELIQKELKNKNITYEF